MAVMGQRPSSGTNSRYSKTTGFQGSAPARSEQRPEGDVTGGREEASVPRFKAGDGAGTDIDNTGGGDRPGS